MNSNRSSRSVRPSDPYPTPFGTDPGTAAAFDRARRAAAATGFEGSEEPSSRQGDAALAGGGIDRGVGPSTHGPTLTPQRDQLHNRSTPRRPYVSFGQRSPVEEADPRGDAGGDAAGTRAGGAGRLLANGHFVLQATIDHIRDLRDQYQTPRGDDGKPNPYGEALGLVGIKGGQSSNYELRPAGRAFVLQVRDDHKAQHLSVSNRSIASIIQIPSREVQSVFRKEGVSGRTTAPHHDDAGEPSSRPGEAAPPPQRAPASRAGPRSYVQFGQEAPGRSQDSPLSSRHVGDRMEDVSEAESARQAAGMPEPEGLVKGYANTVTSRGVPFDGDFTNVVRTGPNSAHVETTSLDGVVIEDQDRAQDQFTPVLRHRTFGGVSPAGEGAPPGGEPMEGVLPAPIGVQRGPDPVAAVREALDGVAGAPDRDAPIDHGAPWSGERVGQRTREADAAELERNAAGRPEPEGSQKMFFNGNVKTRFKVLKERSEVEIMTFRANTRAASTLESIQRVGAEALTPELRSVVFGPSHVEPPAHLLNPAPLLNMDLFGVYSYDENGVGRFYNMFNLTSTRFVVRQPFETAEVFVEHVDGSRLPGYLVTADQMERPLRNLVFGGQPPT